MQIAKEVIIGQRFRYGFVSHRISPTVVTNRNAATTAHSVLVVRTKRRRTNVFRIAHDFLPMAISMDSALPLPSVASERFVTAYRFAKAVQKSFA